MQNKFQKCKNSKKCEKRTNLNDNITNRMCEISEHVSSIIPTKTDDVEKRKKAQS